MLSVVSAVIGMLVMFILSLSALPSVVTALSYLLAWLLITVILGFSIGTPEKVKTKLQKFIKKFK